MQNDAALTIIPVTPRFKLIKYALFLICLSASLLVLSCSKPKEEAPPTGTDTTTTPSTPADTNTPATPAGYTYTFDSSFKATGTFATMGALQADGKIIVANNAQIARLNKDGSLDNSFVTGNAGNGEFHSLALQKDGKILLGGSFTTYNNQNMAYYLRLNSDGTIDNSFEVQELIVLGRIETDIKSIAIQPDGKILIGGSFFHPLSYQNSLYTGVRHLIRVNTDGSYDATFQHSLLDHSIVECIHILKDGKTLVTGQLVSAMYYLTPENGTQYNYIFKLNADGSLDPSFKYDAKLDMRDPYKHLPTLGLTIAVQDDNKILLGGRFETTSDDVNQDYRGIVRLNQDGTIDASYPKRGYNNIVTSILLSSDRVIIGSIHDPGKTYLDASLAILLFNRDGSDNSNFKLKGFPGFGDTYTVIEDENKNLLLLGKIYDKMGVPVYTFHGIVRLLRS